MIYMIAEVNSVDGNYEMKFVTSYGASIEEAIKNYLDWSYNINRNVSERFICKNPSPIVYGESMNSHRFNDDEYKLWKKYYSNNYVMDGKIVKASWVQF